MSNLELLTPSSTLGIYGHRDQSDLEPAMDAYASWLGQLRGERNRSPRS